MAMAREQPLPGSRTGPTKPGYYRTAAELALGHANRRHCLPGWKRLCFYFQLNLPTRHPRWAAVHFTLMLIHTKSKYGCSWHWWTTSRSKERQPLPHSAIPFHCEISGERELTCFEVGMDPRTRQVQSLPQQTICHEAHPESPSLAASFGWARLGG